MKLDDSRYNAGNTNIDQSEIWYRPLGEDLDNGTEPLLIYDYIL
uniref:Uncharacterized protein n=1 Tax=Moniliophthora roreri TaxID=221103 RepID=A0A0W0F360_MONRR